MRYALSKLTAASLILVCLACGATATPLLDQNRGVLTIAPVLEKVTPGVVNISVAQQTNNTQNPLLSDPFFRRFFGIPDQTQRNPDATSAGSGVIIDADKGFVLTNHHVIDNAAKIVVTLKDQRSFQARLVGSDPATDIALLQIKANNLTAVPIGNSDNAQVGDVVIAIGNPFGIGQTVTSGIVSALGRSGLGIEGYEDFIQTDASINPGNSGGALINSKGELIGINTAIIGPSGGNVGIGFAVPSNMASAVSQQLAQYGEVRRGRLGVVIQDLTPDIAKALDLAESDGAIVSRVEQNSPAAEAGLKAGDVIVAIDDRPVRNASDLRNNIGLTPQGKTVAITIVRNGKKLNKNVTISAAKMDQVAGDETISELAGAIFAANTDNRGVSAKSVEPGSPAWRYGLRPGDNVIAVNRVGVESLPQFRETLEKAGPVVALHINRDGREFFILIQR